METTALRRLGLAAGAVAAFAAAGCGSDDGNDAEQSKPSSGAPYTGADLKRFVITEDDLPDGYDTVEHKDSSSAASCLSNAGKGATPTALSRAFTKLGFKACAGASFVRKINDGISKNNRPAGLAILMRDEDGASKALPVLRKGLINSFSATGSASAFTPHSLPVPNLGDEATRGATLAADLGPGLGKATFYIYTWRRGNVVVWIGSSNFIKDFDQDSTLDLARTLDERGQK
jgi:hypothetical protein